MTAPTEPTLNVEYDELMKRADELEVPIPGPFNYSPQPPSQLVQATGAAAQLALSAEDMRRYMAAGMREWQNLAESLRNAAKAYEETDASSRTWPARGHRRCCTSCCAMVCRRKE